MSPSRALPAATLLAALAVLAACGQETGTAGTDAAAARTPGSTSTTASPEPPTLTGEEVHWGYSGEVGPQHWADLSAEFEACAAGDAQSPVDLPTSAPRGAEPLEVDYGEVPDHVANNGHSIQLFADADAELEVDGVDYTLDQFHFHAPSEHTVDGRRFPVEFHFVNVDDAGDTTVLAAFGTEGPRDNPDWAPFVAAAGTPVDVEVPGRIDLTEMLPDSLEHFSYEGSLTTPPCTQGVHWAVLSTPVELGAGQVEALASAYADNNRPRQALGDRPVVLASGQLD